MARRRKPILRFFRKKHMDEPVLDQGPIDPQVIEETPASEQVEIPQETVETPVETVEAPQDVVSAIEEQDATEGVQDENIEMVEKKTEVSESPEEAEDRSAYNCPACSGDGLIDGQRCTQCGGTGKV